MRLHATCLRVHLGSVQPDSLDSLAVVLEQAGAGEQDRQKQDQRWRDHLVPVAEERRLDHRRIERDEGSAVRRGAYVLGDLTADEQVVEAEYVDDLRGERHDRNHLHAVGLTRAHLVEVGDPEVEDREE